MDLFLKILWIFVQIKYKDIYNLLNLNYNIDDILILIGKWKDEKSHIFFINPVNFNLFDSVKTTDLILFL